MKVVIKGYLPMKHIMLFGILFSKEEPSEQELAHYEIHSQQYFEVFLVTFVLMMGMYYFNLINIFSAVLVSAFMYYLVYAIFTVFSFAKSRSFRTFNRYNPFELEAFGHEMEAEYMDNRRWLAWLRWI